MRMTAIFPISQSVPVFDTYLYVYSAAMPIRMDNHMSVECISHYHFHCNVAIFIWMKQKQRKPPPNPTQT